MGHPTAIVVGGGGPVDPAVRARLPEGAPVVAADGGVDVAHAVDLHVDVVVGDLDSVTPGGLAEAERAGALVERYPVEKDATDLALALERAASMVGDGGELVVVGTDGGRLDHLLAGLLALTDPRLPRLRAHIGPAVVHVLHGPGELRLAAEPDALLTIVPVGDAAGVRTDGLRYPLAGEALPSGTTRGVSNVVGPTGDVVVALDAGTLLVVLPGGTS
jgi:thiamine pyrophosphokinase